MEPVDKKYLLEAFERAKAHQGRALAALGHPVSKPPPASMPAGTTTPAESSDSTSITPAAREAN
ncbi:MAG TPA: hypothetical protein VHV75_17210 [Solirubrobacteraceae bacterium]|nr:hypothetical protein [Solirubrobacteraceae bacterium]